MSEPTSDRKSALAQIAERWDSERSERTLARTQRALQRREQRGRALAYAGALSLLGMAGVVTWSLMRADVASAPAAQTPAADAAPGAPGGNARAERMQLADGSEISLLDSAAHVLMREVSATRTAVELPAGRAHFEIVHRAERVFRVLCGEVTVEVLGTSFELERDGSRTRVSVARGRVAVQWADQRTELSAGEAGWFPKPGPGAASASPAAPKSNTPAAQAAWREPAERGDFKHAYTLLARAKDAPLDDVEELMLAADTARLSGHPAAALPFLNRVVAHHAQDARAPLAAFTLGGILMQQLGRPLDAEAAYARARELSLDSSLAQDALARQVEAAHRAGDAARAGRLAAEYLARYPDGRRVHAVRRFGGLEAE